MSFESKHFAQPLNNQETPSFISLIISANSAKLFKWEESLHEVQNLCNKTDVIYLLWTHCEPSMSLDLYTDQP